MEPPNLITAEHTPLKSWHPAAILGAATTQEGGSFQEYGVIVLNQPIENVDLFVKVCHSASMIVAADGGANRIYDLALHHKLKAEAQGICQPSAIVGDLDSLRADVKESFQAKGVKIIREADQNSTDFTKSLKYLASSSTSKFKTAVAFGGLGGRADQAFAQLHQLYAAAAAATSATDPDPPAFESLYLFTPESIIFVLEKGRNKIFTPVKPGLLGENVGIIPLARPAVISTRGLEWDVAHWSTSFGTQVSTSNHIRDDHVLIQTDERVLFTLEIATKVPP